MDTLLELPPRIRMTRGERRSISGNDGKFEAILTLMFLKTLNGGSINYEGLRTLLLTSAFDAGYRRRDWNSRGRPCRFISHTVSRTQLRSGSSV